MTRKLYYEDCQLTEFIARVTGCEEGKGGFRVTLDATAFYPEGGGQPWDLGTLGEANVLEVREEGEEVIHLCDRSLRVGETVTGVIDWNRRFDLMQQHTGEHILSGVIHAKYGYHNVGFHMGADVITIDFDGLIPAEDLKELEDTVNEALWKNLPVRCWYPSPEELPNVGYRTKKALPWPVRIVEVPGYDKCACCGVHTATTGQVGLVKIFSSMKFHGGSRLEMACGKRAMDLLTAVFDQNRLVSQAFSAQILQTGAAAAKMNELLEQEKFRAGRLERQLFESIAKSYVNYGDVLHFQDDLSGVGVRDLADKLADTCGGMAAVFSGTDDKGYNFCLAARQGDLRQLGKELITALNGRGGGKPGFIQGSVKATKAQIEGFFGK